MVSSISFVQANLQHSIAASRVLSRTVAVKGIDMALVQEPRLREGCIMGLNIPGYTLFCGSGTHRPRTCILAKNRNIRMLPGFSFRDLVAVQIEYDEGEEKRSVVVCSVYLPFDSDLPPTREFEELLHYCEEKTLSRIVGCDSNCHHTVCGSTNCNDRGMALVEFLNPTNLEILIRGNEPTFCNSRRVEVLDITLGSCELLERIKDWGVSSEPSLSDHSHIMLQLVGSVPAGFFRDPRSTNWDSFQEDLVSRLEQRPKIDVKDKAGLGLAIAFLQGTLITAYENNCPHKAERKGKCSLK
jgi:exonuclease III